MSKKVQRKVEVKVERKFYKSKTAHQQTTCFCSSLVRETLQTKGNPRPFSNLGPRGTVTT